ncbi:MAG: UvrD-helicase domain-containing protein, partial [Desulfobacteraceae bacterium]
DTGSLERSYQKAFQKLVRAWRDRKHEVADILLHHKNLRRNRYRTDWVRGWIRSMDLLALSERAAPFLFENFRKFTTTGLAEGAGDKGPPPDHPFFRLCDQLYGLREELEQAFDQRLLALKAELLENARAEISRSKEGRNVQSFDDLLLGVKKALSSGAGEALSAELRERFGAALVDEFQDTDPVQYGIFKEIFGGGRSPLFLIGDPKQAIYSFRGADIFAYMEAVGEADRSYTLPRNRRSEPGLVRAVNTVFGGHPAPFVFDRIPFHPAEPAAADKDQEPLLIRGAQGPHLHVWFVQDTDDKGIPKAPTKEDARRRIIEAVTTEISRLTALGRKGLAVLGERPLQEGDMAVLLPTNSDAELVKRSLEAARIPAVLYTTSSLFDSHEADETAVLLAALLRPEHHGLLKAALMTDLLGWTAAGLHDLASDPDAWEAKVVEFRELHRAWKERGFMVMFREFLRREDVLPRLLTFPDGERRATNLLHLSEILHQEEADRATGMAGLAKLLAEKRDSKTRGPDEQQLRLESDEKAVKLITIHRSKGLEFPVVFCPFLWRRSEAGTPLIFHDPDARLEFTVDLGSSDQGRSRALAEKEKLSENLRLAYVALTRARNRCYLAWGKFNKAETSAPAYLFHARDASRESPVEDARERFKSLDDARVLGELKTLAEKAGGAIEVRPLPQTPEALSLPEAPLPAELQARSFAGSIDRTWRISSFSSLTSSLPHAEELADYDPEPEGPADPEILLNDEEPSGIFAFPKGAGAGSCLHQVFEKIDFTDPGTFAPAAASSLEAHGFDPGWEPVVTEMVERVVSAPLEPGIALNQVPFSRRLIELPFLFPLRMIT